MGEHTFFVRSIGAEGNVEATPAEYGWAIGILTAPVTTITAKPALFTEDRTPTFEFSSTTPGAVLPVLDRRLAVRRLHVAEDVHGAAAVRRQRPGQRRDRRPAHVRRARARAPPARRADRGRVRVDDRGPRRARDDDRLRPARRARCPRRRPSSSSPATSSTRASSARSTRSACPSTAPAPARRRTTSSSSTSSPARTRSTCAPSTRA